MSACVGQCLLSSADFYHRSETGSFLWWHLTTCQLYSREVKRILISIIFITATVLFLAEEKMRQRTRDWLTKTFDSEETNAGDCLLAMAAVIVEEMRAAVFEQTGFRCSAGIAHNKVRV